MAGLQDPFPDYLIGPSDVLSVVVFKENDLSMPQVTVDSRGTFQMPLLGTISAAGKTTEQLSRELTVGLGSRYIVSPSVAVNVVSAGSHKFTIEGAVTSPGVYEFQPDTTLLGAIATAKGPTRVAKLNQVAIFRNAGGVRKVAVIDLKAVREGRLADPRLEAGDSIVVGFSGLTQAWQDFLQAIPAAALFTRL
jgi:polysaccharide export outer membrane protein